MKRVAYVLLLILLPITDSAAQNTPANAFSVGDIRIYGKPVDNQTRCEHWHSALDIIAIKFICCGRYYPCHSCHEETAFHKAEVWPRDKFDEKAVLCGVCGHELTINEYMSCESACPKCASKFNPGCSKHYHLYFETEQSPDKQ